MTDGAVGDGAEPRSVPTRADRTEFERFRALIYKVAGIQIPRTKKVMVTNRLRRRLRATGIATFAAYYAHLTSPRGRGRDAGVPRRDHDQRDLFLPRPPPLRMARRDVPARVRPPGRPRKRPEPADLVGGLRTGEELYSIALKVAANRPTSPAGRSRSSGPTSAAPRSRRPGPAATTSGPSASSPIEERKQAFDLDPAKQRWTLKPEVRSLVTWKLHNLLRPIGRSRSTASSSRTC